MKCFTLQCLSLSERAGTFSLVTDNLMLKVNINCFSDYSNLHLKQRFSVMKCCAFDMLLFCHCIWWIIACMIDGSMDPRCFRLVIFPTPPLLGGFQCEDLGSAVSWIGEWFPLFLRSRIVCVKPESFFTVQ